MRTKIVWRRPLLTFSQLAILLAVLLGLYVVLDLNRRAQAGRLVGVGEESLRGELDKESTRQIELQATLAYVKSDEYVSAYAREEGGFLLPGEKRVVPLIPAATPRSILAQEPTPDTAERARPWQAWWKLLTDSPLPSP